MTDLNSLIVQKSAKYRIVARPSDDVNYPVKYVAQMQGYWGWWWDINWSYSQASTEEYVTQNYNKKHRILPQQFPEKVIKEITL